MGATETGRKQRTPDMEETKFLQFDVVTDFSDHHYARKASKNQCLFSSPSTNLSKKIMMEWKILEDNLPEQIFVHAYERRMDLLRAVIVGASRTPYHDGLYFFDIQFPDHYPNIPPKVRYRSHGLNINPNLYTNGAVCLSLLNTWKGTGREKWDPQSSTILQVLVSLQGLVLNEKPYYNEPALKPAFSSSAYNKKVFLLCCKTSLHLMRKPPRNFEDFVMDHFKNHGRGLLRACRAYRIGLAKIGWFEDDGRDFDVLVSSWMRKRSNVVVSRDFKEELDRIYVQMYVELKRIGASMEGVPDDLKKVEVEVEKNKLKKFRVRVSQMISKFKGWFGKDNKGKEKQGDSLVGDD